MADPVRASVTIDAPVRRVMEIVSDLEDTDRWANEARAADVQDRDADGRPSRIAVTLGAIGFSTTATYAVSYTEDSVTLECVAGNLISASTITYTAHDEGEGRTRLDMTSTMEVTVPVPRWGLDLAMRRSAEKNLDSVRIDAEKDPSPT